MELISDFGRNPIGSGSTLSLLLLKKQQRAPLRSFSQKIIICTGIKADIHIIY